MFDGSYVIVDGLYLQFILQVDSAQVRLLSSSLICLKLPRYRVQCGISIRQRYQLGIFNPEIQLADAFKVAGFPVCT